MRLYDCIFYYRTVTKYLVPNGWAIFSSLLLHCPILIPRDSNSKYQRVCKSQLAKELENTHYGSNTLLLGLLIMMSSCK